MDKNCEEDADSFNCSTKTDSVDVIYDSEDDEHPLEIAYIPLDLGKVHKGKSDKFLSPSADLNRCSTPGTMSYSARGLSTHSSLGLLTFR